MGIFDEVLYFFYLKGSRSKLRNGGRAEKAEAEKAVISFQNEEEKSECIDYKLAFKWYE